MSIEDILSGVVVAILIGISIISRYVRYRANSEQKSATKQRYNREESMTIFDKIRLEIEEKIGALEQHPDSSERIIEEISSVESPKRVCKQGSQRSKTDKPSAQNATNRTFQKPTTVDKKPDKTDKSSRKFNLRDAVIYSEILTPKFKQEE